jgi:hypothetical protein
MVSLNGSIIKVPFKRMLGLAIGSVADRRINGKLHNSMEPVRYKNPPKYANVLRQSGIHEAVRTWGRVWNLSNPVLVEKTPEWFYTNMEDMHSALKGFNDTTGPLASVNPVYVVMWRPLCLGILSSHFRKNAQKDGLYAFTHEVKLLNRTVQIAEWAVAQGVKMELINYADLIWKPQRVVASLKRLLPCIANRGYNTDFHPHQNKEYFPKNKFKVIGSTASYGKAHPPTKARLGGSSYDTEKNRCKEIKGIPKSIESDPKFIKLLETNRMLEFKLEALAFVLAKRDPIKV